MPKKYYEATEEVGGRIFSECGFDLDKVVSDVVDDCSKKTTKTQNINKKRKSLFCDCCGKKQHTDEVEYFQSCSLKTN